MRRQTPRAARRLDSPKDEEFERITALCGSALDVPICLVSLVDERRQWFLSNRGLGATKETGREIAFCARGGGAGTKRSLVPSPSEPRRRRGRGGDSPWMCHAAARVRVVSGPATARFAPRPRRGFSARRGAALAAARVVARDDGGSRRRDRAAAGTRSCRPRTTSPRRSWSSATRSRTRASPSRRWCWAGRTSGSTRARRCWWAGRTA